MFWNHLILQQSYATTEHLKAGVASAVAKISTFATLASSHKVASGATPVDHFGFVVDTADRRLGAGLGDAPGVLMNT